MRMEHDMDLDENESGGLGEALEREIRERVFGQGFMKIVQSVRRGGEVTKMSMRPVEIGGAKMFQFETSAGGRVQVKNFPADGAAELIDDFVRQSGARELHLITATGDLHVRVTKKGRVMVSRSAEMNREAAVRPHDRVKNTPLTSFDSFALLQAIGLADRSGAVRASMRGKYDQVNEFLRNVGDVVGRHVPSSGDAEKPFTVVDCGCGKAYLTISLYYYLAMTLGYPDVRVFGVDRRGDVIAAARRMAAQLDISDKVVFVESDISAFTPPSAATMVVSLHACDTATDEALAKAVEWKARYVLSAPCCQHELQKAIGQGGGRSRPEADFAGLLRQGILRERLCDILTDSFRAMIMRIMGYRSQVVEFVSSEATARNIMLKCEYGVRPGQPGPVGEYLGLRDYWNVVPWLETRLGEAFSRHLSKFG